LFVDGNGERWLFVCWSSLTITINKQTIISHHYNQQTNNHLSPLPSINKQSSLTININKQTIISHHYHQQTNNHLSPLPSTNKQSYLTITINKQPISYEITKSSRILEHHSCSTKVYQNTIKKTNEVRFVVDQYA
jgi:hypothetical protein